MQEPTNVTSKGELRNFLGTVNQLGNYIPWRAEKDKLLCDLTEKPCRLWEADRPMVYHAVVSSCVGHAGPSSGLGLGLGLPMHHVRLGRQPSPALGGRMEACGSRIAVASSNQTSPGTGGRAGCVLGFTQSGIC